MWVPFLQSEVAMGFFLPFQKWTPSSAELVNCCQLWSLRDVTEKVNDWKQYAIWRKGYPTIVMQSMIDVMKVQYNNNNYCTCYTA